jgi:hypothetical protein
MQLNAVRKKLGFLDGKPGGKCGGRATLSRFTAHAARTWLGELLFACREAAGDASRKMAQWVGPANESRLTAVAANAMMGRCENLPIYYCSAA